MKESYILSIDIGTSSVKGGLVDPQGRMAAYYRVPLDTFKGIDYTKWDPGVWITGVKHLVDHFSAIRNGFLVSHIDGIVISGNGPTLVPVGKNGAPEFYGLLWLDGRALFIPGRKSFYLPKINWLKDFSRTIYNKTTWFLPCSEYVSYFLTGNAVAVTHSEEFSPFIWSESDIEEYRIDKNKLPPFVSIGEKIGEVTREAQIATGLTQGTPVIAGGIDYISSLIGTGALEEGMVCDRAGTSEGINFCTTRNISVQGLRSLPHVNEGFYNVSGVLPATGGIFEWFRRITAQENLPYDRMMEDISRSRSGKVFFFPYFHNQKYSNLDGGMFTGLRLSTSKGEMGRAVVEALGWAVFEKLEILEANGCYVDEMRLSGGQGRNDLWNQMKADITGRRLVVPEILDAEILGNSCIGYTYLDEYSSINEAAKEMFRPHRVFTPNKEYFAHFKRGYDLYREMLQTLSR